MLNINVFNINFNNLICFKGRRNLRFNFLQSIFYNKMLKITELSSKWCITCFIKVTISASNMYFKQS